MSRRYLNQGPGGPKYSNLSVSPVTVSRGAQAVRIHVSQAGRGLTSDSVILDAEQVVNLRDYLLEICPCAGKEAPKPVKFIDE